MFNVFSYMYTHIKDHFSTGKNVVINFQTHTLEVEE